MHDPLNSLPHILWGLFGPFPWRQGISTGRSGCYAQQKVAFVSCEARG